MICSKCGISLPDDAVFCSNCGTKQKFETTTAVSPVTTQPATNASETTWKDLLSSFLDLLKTVVGKIIAVVVIVVIGIVIFKNNPQWFGDVGDLVSDIAQKDDPNVLAVKGGSPYTYPDITYEQAFSAFFSSPTWKYFVGTQEGPDDDGDGKPDYTRSNVDVVEFTGYCMYSNTKVKAKIQFVLEKDKGTFTTSCLAFNDVPQSNLFMIALIQKAFSEYKK